MAGNVAPSTAPDIRTRLAATVGNEGLERLARLLNLDLIRQPVGSSGLRHVVDHSARKRQGGEFAADNAPRQVASLSPYQARLALQQYRDIAAL